MTQESSSIGRSGTRAVAVAGGVVALSGFLVQAVATRPLAEAELSQFLGFWAMAFAVIGVVGGLQHEATRATAQAALVGAVDGARIVPAVLAVGLGAAVLVLATSPLWADGIMPVQPGLGAVLIAFAVAAFAGHAGLVGVLAGRRRWLVYSRLMAAESVVRVLLVAVVLLLGATLVGYEIATAAATATWLLTLPLSASVRSAWGQRADVAVLPFLQRSGHALVASVSTAVLVVGFPAIVGITSSREEYLSVGTLILALSLTRAPLLLPINTFQGVAIQYFVTAGERRSAALARLVGVVLAVGAVGTLLAALVGPWLMRVVTGRDIGAGTLAALTVASTLLAVLVLTGTVALATGRHRAYSSGWAASALVAVGLLLTPLPIVDRILVSLAVGPVVGVLLHVLALRAQPDPAHPVPDDRSDRV